MKIILGIIVVLLMAYLLLIMPNLNSQKRVEKLKGSLYAHRGFHDNKSEAPENSMLAFRKAVELGYGIELDVQLTKDKQVVVFHDYNLKRVCGVDKEVNACTYEELQQYVLLNSNEKIPLFIDFLQLVNGKVPLIVEIKKRNSKDPICEYAYDILKEYNGIYCIESFHPLAVLWFKQNYPEIVRGQLSMNYHRDSDEKITPVYFALRHLLFNFLTKPDFIAYDYRAKKSVSKNLCRKLYGCISVAWTISSQDIMNEAIDYYDLFIFEGFKPR